MIRLALQSVLVLTLAAPAFCRSRTPIEAPEDLNDAVGVAVGAAQTTGRIITTNAARAPRPPIQQVMFKPGPLANAASKACSGNPGNASILSVIRLHGPLHYYSNPAPLNFTIGVPEEECPQPLENALFIIGHGIGNGLGYFYATSSQAEIVQAVKSVYVPGNGVKFEPIANITPDIQADFDKLVENVISVHGTIAQR